MSEKQPLLKRILYYRWIYLLLLPGLVHLLIFAYGPMYGLQLAFRSFSHADGIWGSQWVGLDNFRFMVSHPLFFNSVRNTFTISIMHLVFGFPAPIILAILINELRSRKLSRVLQTIFTFPNFLSWIVLSGITFQLFASAGLVNGVVQTVFPEWSNSVLRSGSQYRWFLVFSGIWQGAGWSSIIYLAAIAGIDPSLYESATMDGANRWHRIRHITWPGMQMTAMMLLILAIGAIMGGNFDQIFNTINALTNSHGEIVSVFVMQQFQGLAPNYGFLTSVGMFNGLINAALLISANMIVKKVKGQALFSLGS